jgi:hypothetical protein
VVLPLIDTMLVSVVSGNYIQPSIADVTVLYAPVQKAASRGHQLAKGSEF